MSTRVETGEDITVSPVNLEDVTEIVQIDAAITGAPKADFWYAHYVRQNTDPSALLFVARRNEQVIGYVLGSVQAWEFGSPPCGWIEAIAVRPEHRHLQVASRLFDASIAYFREHSINVIRTMVHIDAQDLIAFFRMQGMAAGPYIELEMRAD
jgi:GNAT superfamily N-acetyltransferase